MVGCLLKFNHFQPHIFSRFIIHQQNREEKTLLQLHTKNFEEGVRALIRGWAHIFSKLFSMNKAKKKEHCSNFIPSIYDSLRKGGQWGYASLGAY